MPNHITNIISFEGDPQAIQKMLRAIAYNDPSKRNIPDGINTIDFNKIIPQPAGLYRGDLGIKEMEEYGKNNWYDWNTGNWGTKWKCETFVTEKVTHKKKAKFSFRRTDNLTGGMRE